MVSFWPWKGDSDSTASFEKTLSTLSTKIADNQARLDKVRSSSRRVKVLCTLYLGFAYLVYAIVALLVVGHRYMGPYEWTGLAGGPVLIYGTRTILSAYFNFRIETLEGRLKEQQEERAKTIQKLKDATKYDSTLELIEKYGGADGSPRGKKTGEAGDDESIHADGDDMRPKSRGKTGRQSMGTPGRTSMPPPATANIQRRPDGSPMTPRQAPPIDSSPMEPGAEFAPNAEYTQAGTPASRQQPPSYNQQQQQQQQQQPFRQTGPPPTAESNWYDRIFDVLLGEDETAPKNRIVLICRSCRLVNGQAPPGTKSLADVGMWRCMGCGAQNGEVKEDEGQRIVREVLGENKKKVPVKDGEQTSAAEAEVEVVSESSDDDAAAADGPAASVKKRRGKA